MKSAVYCGSRNLYPHMGPSIKSLLIHSTVDRIYLLIEDDEFPEKLPSCISVINVSKLHLFDQNGPNMRLHFTYLAMIRGVLAEILPDDVVLSLDCDTIVQDTIEELWSTDLTGYYLAAVREPTKSKGGQFQYLCIRPTDLYVNTGVALYNLQKLRNDGKAREILQWMNSTYSPWPEQDAYNLFCEGYIKELDPKYNQTAYTPIVYHAHILHFAGYREWWGFPEVQKYREISWEEVMYRHGRN